MFSIEEVKFQQLQGHVLKVEQTPNGERIALVKCLDDKCVEWFPIVNNLIVRDRDLVKITDTDPDGISNECITEIL